MKFSTITVLAILATASLASAGTLDRPGATPEQSNLLPQGGMGQPTAMSMDNPQVTVAKQLTVGVWHFMAGKNSNDMVFKTDGTVALLNASAGGQIHWKIVDKQVVITAGNMKLYLYLPLNPSGQTKGADPRGRPLVATWSNGAAPVTPVATPAAVANSGSSTAMPTPPPFAPSVPSSPGSGGGSSFFGTEQER